MATEGLLPYLLTFLFHIACSIDVGVLSIARLHSDPPIQWYTYTNNSMITITLIGPADRWFGIGIGNATMHNTYTFIVDEDGSLSEHRLGNHNTGKHTHIPHSSNRQIQTHLQQGDILPTSITDLSYNQTTENGIRTVEITRSREAYSNLFYTFPNSRSDNVPLIAAWALDSGEAFRATSNHGTSNKLQSFVNFVLSNETTPDPTSAPTITPTRSPSVAPTTAPSLAPSIAPTTSPTNAPTELYQNRFDLNGSVTLGGDQLDRIDLVIGIEADTQTLFLNVSGPTAQWFAVGFGSGTAMKDKYAVIVDWTPQTNGFSVIGDDDVLEYWLGFHVANEALDKLIETKIQYPMPAFRRNVLMERPTYKVDDEDGNYYNFSLCNRWYTVVWARGEYSPKEDASFGSAHSVQNRGSGSIYVEGEMFRKCNGVGRRFGNVYALLVFVQLLFVLLS